MSSTEILGLMAASSANLSGVGGHSHNPVTAFDVAAMIAGVPREVELLAYAKYVGDHESAKRLYFHVYQWAAGEAATQGWKLTKGKQIVGSMSMLAVAEFIYPHTCGLCLGRGFIEDELCFHCAGSGKRSMTGTDKANLIGVEKSCYCRTWRSRYEHIYQYIDNLDSRLQANINRASG